MTKIVRFLFGTEMAKAVPTRTIDAEHWYMAAVICGMLGIRSYSYAVRKHLSEAEWRHETTYIGGRTKNKILLINNSGMLKLILKGQSHNADLVRERARTTPAYLKTAGWPVELDMAA